MKPYADRRAAGRILAPRVAAALGEGMTPLVLALPRGGVPVAAAVADALAAPLDVILVRKIGFPGHVEVAWGAVASIAGTTEVVDNAALFEASAHLDRRDFEARALDEREELARRERVYRGDRPPLAVTGCTVVVVDDGVATGASMRAALLALQSRQPERVLVAVPVCLPGAWQRLRAVADVVCPWFPQHVLAVGQAYQDFAQTTDREVCEILARDRFGDTPPG